MDKLKLALNRQESRQDEDTGIMRTLTDETTLSYTTRVKAFCICFVIGIMMSLLATFALFLHRGLHVFAVFYTIGNVLSMASTCFLMGPFKQLKRMFDPTRLIATIIVIISFILTLVAAIVLKKSGLALVSVIIQFTALTWYSLSYIPYARDAVKKTVTTCIV